MCGRKTEHVSVLKNPVDAEKKDREERVTIDGREYNAAELPPRLLAILARYPHLTDHQVRPDRESVGMKASAVRQAFGWNSDWSDWSDWNSDWSDNIVKNILYKGVQDMVEGSIECPPPRAFATASAVLCEDDLDS